MSSIKNAAFQVHIQNAEAGIVIHRKALFKSTTLNMTFFCHVKFPNSQVVVTLKL